MPSVGHLFCQMVVGMEWFYSWPHLGVRLREESWLPPYHPRVSYGGEGFGISMEGLP